MRNYTSRSENGADAISEDITVKNFAKSRKVMSKGSVDPKQS